MYFFPSSAQLQGKRESHELHVESSESNESIIKDDDAEAENQETASTISNSASESSSPKQKRPSTSSSISSDSEPYLPITPPANEPHPSYFYNIMITPPPTPTSKNRKPKGTPPPNKRALVNLQLPHDGQHLRRSRSSEAANFNRIDLDIGTSSLSK